MLCLNRDKLFRLPTNYIAKQQFWTKSSTEFELDPTLWDRLSPLWHTVWVGDTLSDVQTSCLMLRQAVRFWDKLSDFETSRPSLRQVVWLLYKSSSSRTNCSSFGLTVLPRKLVTKLRAVCDPPQQTAKSILCVRVIFQELYAENVSIYNLWTQLCT